MPVEMRTKRIPVAYHIDRLEYVRLSLTVITHEYDMPMIGWNQTIFDIAEIMCVNRTDLHMLQ